jgi:hypothetical protein
MQPAFRRKTDRTTADSLAWVIFVPLTAVACVAIVALLPPALVLPALSTLLVLAGFAFASGLYLAGHRIDRGPAEAWTTAGALVFLGFAAAIMADGREALAALEQMQVARVAGL